MHWLGVCGIAVALVIMIILALRSVSILIIGPVCAFIVIITNRMALSSAFLTGADSYMIGLGGFISKYLLLFILGAILGKYMEDSGAALSIAHSIVKLTGTDKPFMIMLAVCIIGALLTYGGINMFVAMFTIIPLARPLFKATNLPWHLFIIPQVLGAQTFTMSMLPGSPSVHNAIPTFHLGTTLMAAPLVGIAASIATIIWGLIYMKWQMAKSEARNETFCEGEVLSAKSERELPPLALSLLPLLTLIFIIIAGSLLKIPNIILPAGVISILVASFSFRRYLPDQVLTLNAGALNAMTPALFTAASVGVGIVIVAAPGFQPISRLVSSIPGSPLYSLASTTGILAIATGSAAGALGIVMEAFSDIYLAAGVNPEAIHRIAAIASGGLSCMPYSGGTFTLLAITGLTHKEAYRHILAIGMIGHLIALAVALPLAVWLY